MSQQVLDRNLAKTTWTPSIIPQLYAHKAAPSQFTLFQELTVQIIPSHFWRENSNNSVTLKRSKKYLNEIILNSNLFRLSTYLYVLNFEKEKLKFALVM